ncbi:hypothetical protein KKB10_04965 [Patescibacteria group bacterium]|nr:hypothetical protein [Patescibacteria group bacterium]MBU1075097.1 hypothetical protein [Patescibacteria group bacterium]MBU1952296.1 hypothetical protein [Patescibacteria group bacterium]
MTEKIMAEKSGEIFSPGNLEDMKLEGIPVKQVFEIMEKEGLSPDTIREIMIALGHTRKETDETIEAIEVWSQKEKNK